jgi:hypothetical protein
MEKLWQRVVDARRILERSNITIFFKYKDETRSLKVSGSFSFPVYRIPTRYMLAHDSYMVRKIIVQIFDLVRIFGHE